MQNDKQSKSQKDLHKKYKNVQIIGKGTFGCVYLAESTLQGDNQKVAIKHVHQNKRYKNRQLQILQSIKHENIVELIDFFFQDIQQDTYLNIIMQYLPMTLSSVIKDNLYCKSFIPNNLLIKYSYGLLKALNYLDNEGIAHRDIKPSNILLNQAGDAKLCDFGSAKLLVNGKKNISYICSRYYRSPQLILGAVDYSTAIDMWSLGCCISQMIINRPIFDGANNSVLLIKIIRTIGQPTLEDMDEMKVEKKLLQKVQPSGLKQRILKLNSGAPLQLIQMIEKILVYNPKKRLSAGEALKLGIFHDLHKQTG